MTGCTGKASATTKVTVHIKHTDRGDLRIDLIAPDGTDYKLKSSTSGDNVANLDAHLHGQPVHQGPQRHLEAARPRTSSPAIAADSTHGH